MFEDLYILDAKTGKTITYVTQDTEQGIKKTAKLEEILNRKDKDYIVIHNHPNSSTFSESDLKTLFNSNSISKMMAIGHDETVFKINSKNLDIDIVNELLVCYTKIKKLGYSVSTSEYMAYKIISDRYKLEYERR
ncbi:hypothetical protein [Clostridium sp.]|uniref:hypothetical protein n=1 Tax=Clostridium sp. TaxID=1506 RepID=UPI003216489A